MSFIDFLVTMVVFLLTSFSASGQLDAVHADIRMPAASHADTLEPSPVIAISREVVTLDGHPVVDTPSLGATARLERVDRLVSGLETLRRNWGMIHPRLPFPGTVIVQADRDVDYRVIRKAMFSAALAGYPNLDFAVHLRAAPGRAP